MPVLRKVNMRATCLHQVPFFKFIKNLKTLNPTQPRILLTQIAECFALWPKATADIRQHKHMHRALLRESISCHMHVGHGEKRQPINQ